MRERIWLSLSSILVVLPAATAALIAADVVPIAGSHGLARWFCLSACITAVLAGTLLSAAIGCKTAAHRSWAVLVAVLGATATTLFLAAQGLPFRP